jgi:signal transduction histidine kinase
LEKAFDKFYRGDEVRRSKDGHSSLGLFIVKQLLEQFDRLIKLSNTESDVACVKFQHKVYNIFSIG